MAGNDIAPRPQLEHERLDVYLAAVELYRSIARLPARRGDGDLRDQLRRASSSVALLIAEGAGRTSGADKRRFYEMAKGSALESAAALELLSDSVPPDSYRRCRGLVVRIVQMLTRLGGPPR